MENWCANAYKHYFQQQTISVKTHSTKKQSGLYNVVLGEGEEIFLQKITPIDVTTMDLKRSSNISIDMALLKSATQKSTGIFLDEPKRKLLPRATEVEGKQIQ